MNESIPSQSVVAVQDVTGARVGAAVIDMILMGILFVVMSMIFGQSDSDDGGFSVNLNGRAYQVEEQAYERLRAYLDEATRLLADDPDCREILADLEQAIGDKASRHLGAGRNVLNDGEMKRILDEITPGSRLGYACSMGLVFGAILLVVSMLQMQISKRAKVE